MMHHSTVKFLILISLAATVGQRVALAQNGVAVSRAASTLKDLKGPLSDYIAKADSSYRWVKVREGKIGSAEYAELILTSQTWRDIVWKHRLFVIMPPTAKEATQGVLVIAGGGWKDEYADPDYEEKLPSESQIFTAIAQQLKSPVAVLLHVPQQPMFDGLVEDEIISLTFDKYLTTEDGEWPLLLPMVKSAMRGMDAAQEFCNEEWSMGLESFTVTGASKRGWTTWLVGAVDNRATAIAPMVIDTLNMGPQMDHQLDAWGGYSHKIEPYTKRRIQDRMDTPAGQALREIIDPYAYRDRLLQPKMIMIGTNDQYWPIDALNLYWDDLRGRKYILYVPNNGHDLKDYGRVIGNLAALHEEASGRGDLPELSWSFSEQRGAATLRLVSDRAPKKVRVWRATSQTRDFRQSVWSPRAANSDGDAFVFAMDLPDEGYAVMFGEAEYRQNGFPYYLSTNVRLMSADATATATSNEDTK